MKLSTYAMNSLKIGVVLVILYAIGAYAYFEYHKGAFKVMMKELSAKYHEPDRNDTLNHDSELIHQNLKLTTRNWKRKQVMLTVRQ